MRKVLPEHEIPIVDLTEEAIARRARHSDLTLNPKVAKRVNALNTYLKRLSESDEDLNVEKFMTRVYKLVDDICAPAAKISVCRQGCAHCCQVPVSVTNMEMNYLHLKTGIEFNQLTAVPDVLMPSRDLSYCPLLDQQTAMCSVHEYRPLHCRAFFAVDDPKYCIGNDQRHLLFAVKSSAALEFLYDSLLHISGCNPVHAKWADIRHWISQ